MGFLNLFSFSLLNSLSLSRCLLASSLISSDFLCLSFSISILSLSFSILDESFSILLFFLFLFHEVFLILVSFPHFSSAVLFLFLVFLFLYLFEIFSLTFLQHHLHLSIFHSHHPYAF